MKLYSCAFTGHRPKSFPWKYDEGAKECRLLKETLSEQIKMLVDRGVTDWFSGMALGMDLWAAEIVLNLREKNSALKLHCILPCEGQEIKWSDLSQKQYRSILERADERFYVSQAYTADCMLKRNRYMVDHSSMLLAVYNGSQRSGTGATVRYAQQMDKDIIIIDPISRNVTG